MVDKSNIKYLFFTVSILVVFASFVFAAHVIKTSSGGTSYSVNEDVGFIYNITVNNTDSGQNANITQVNVTLPSGFLYIPGGGTNGTTVQNYSFVNTSSVLSWSNFTYFLFNASGGAVLNYFWFNATASTPGNFNITVTTLNGTGAYSSNISLTINDTTAPSTIAYASPVETTGTNVSKSNIHVNVSATDNGVLGRIVVRLYNSSHSLLNTSISNTGVASYFINFTGLSDGTYRFNATVNDTYGNLNESVLTRVVTLDTTNPTASLSCTPNPVLSGSVITCTCSPSDATSGIQTNSYTVNPSTVNTGTYSTSCTVTDFAGNSVTTSFSYTVEITGGSSGGGGGGSNSNTNWQSTIPYGSLDDKGPVTKSLSENQRISIRVSGDSSDHHVGVLDILSNTVKILVSSTPQESTLSSGQTKKFDIDSDSTDYDIAVTLNSIKNNKADLTIKSIKEDIPLPGLSPPSQDAEITESPDQNLFQEDTALSPINQEDKSYLSIVVSIIAIAALLGIVVSIVMNRKKRR